MAHFLRRQVYYEELFFYKKTDVLYQLTFAFTRRFLKANDRTVDQMKQAARSGRQNIAEGCADDVSSTEMEIRLINVARVSIKELKEDYEDYLTARNMCKWDDRHPRFADMLAYCRIHNKLEDFSGMFSKASDEELAQLEQTFIEEGGIKERMTAARLGRRQTQNETIEAQAHEIEQLKERIKQLEQELMRYKSQG